MREPASGVALRRQSPTVGAQAPLMPFPLGEILKLGARGESRSEIPLLTKAPSFLPEFSRGLRERIECASQRRPSMPA